MLETKQKPQPFLWNIKGIINILFFQVKLLYFCIGTSVREQRAKSWGCVLLSTVCCCLPCSWLQWRKMRHHTLVDWSALQKSPSIWEKKDEQPSGSFSTSCQCTFANAKVLCEAVCCLPGSSLHPASCSITLRGSGGKAWVLHHGAHSQGFLSAGSALWLCPDGWGEQPAHNINQQQ